LDGQVLALPIQMKIKHDHRFVLRDCSCSAPSILFATFLKQTPAIITVPSRPPLPPAPAQKSDHSSFSLSPGLIHNDQTRVPAAMRTNLLFGDVRFEEDIRTAKEIERRQWLGDLQKQIEDNKRSKFTRHEVERRQDFLNENVQSLIQEAANRHQTTKETLTQPTGQDINRLNRPQASIYPAHDTIHETGEFD
jgi:hypothetical protein